MNPETLRDRLRGVIGGSVRSAVPTPARTVSVEPQPGGERSLDAALGGEWRSNCHGRSFVVTRRFAPEHVYGAQPVGGFAESLERAAPAATLTVSGASMPLLFFDLETTGLSGGAGTYAFIVGCGWFDADGSFVTEQHLMVDYGHERAMLALVADVVGRSGALVTFNGKSFDAPVIETRYLFHRLESPCTNRPHLDLLHPARRFWAGDDGSSLITLEAQVLGATRSGDVPGFEIPARYFQFVRSGDPSPLLDVLSHNRLDLLSLAGLTARYLSLIDRGAGEAGTAQEALGLGRVFEGVNRVESAETAFQRALELVGGRWELLAVAIEARRSLARLARRQRRYGDAAQHWRHLLELPRCPTAIAREATEALAIHHEHRVRDLMTARSFALKSLEIEGRVAWGDATRHRLARIERKLVSERRPSLFSPPLPLSSEPLPSALRTSS